MANPIDALNQATMADPSVVRGYARPDELSPPERALFDRVRDEVRGQPILDLGVGGGRTTEPLRAISEDYVGVDYSPRMVEVCSRNHPDARIELGDARKLRFADGTFALCVFSCNGIGMVSHEDRLLILGEVQRVLRPGGAFVFSTHNRQCPDHEGRFRFPKLEWSKNPLRVGVRALRFAKETALRVRNRRRNKPHEQRLEGHSIINDECHHYATLLYYIDIEAQRRQLVDAGFEPGAVAFDLSGSIITTGSRDSSLAFLARKPG